MAGATLALLLTAVSARAQFGRNKVQYDRFDFRVLETPHFDVYYYPREADAAAIAGRLAERWYDRLSQILQHTFDRRQPLILYASQAHFVQTSLLPGSVPEGVGGFTDHRAGRVVLPFGASLGDTEHVLGHELVHAFQRDILRHAGQSLAGLPLWYSEGMAEELSLGTLDAQTRMWLRDAVAHDHLPTISELDNPRWFPYRYGQALWAFLIAEYGESVALRSLTAKGGASAIHRLETVTGQSVDDLTHRWHAYIHGVTGAVTTPKQQGVVIGGSHYNLAPSLSPDGRTLVYLSERDHDSMDVFAADAATGATVRKLFTTATDTHLDSVQFIDSYGSWDAAGRAFVLATVTSGEPTLTIFDMPAGTVRRHLGVPGVDQIFTPTWSPDGTQIAFSALKGGVTDIYAINIADGHLRALTSDPYSDLQPTWSPDGTTIAFASDRFSSALDTLTFGHHEIGLIDLASGQVRYAGGLAGGKNINPQWCPSSTCLYFVSDANGVSNVYRLQLASRQIAAITDEVIGISGITSLSPAISVGGGGSRLMAAVYNNGGYEIRTFDLAQATGSVVVAPASSGSPTVTAVSGTSTFLTRPYSPRLSLFTLGQPYLSAGGGPFGNYVRAGASLALGDLLGQHEVQTAVEVGKAVSDFGMEVAYINRASRWNWGVQVSQIPWIVGAATVTRTGNDANGAPISYQDAIVDRQQHRQIAALAIYPFSRVRRLEASIGLDAVAFSRQTNTTTFAGSDGRPLGETSSTVPLEAATTSLVSGVAFVQDTALYGVTGPIVGERYRLGVSSTSGGLSVVTAVGDYRRYLEVRRMLTVAVRLQQLARFGPDASDPRVLPLVWAPRDIVRGFVPDGVTTLAWAVSSINLEARAPLADLLRVSTNKLPIDLFTFSDWARFSAASREQLWSVGLGARINAAGVVFEFNGVRPVEPLSGWRLELNLRPGF
jgi:hypothetical protein